MSVIRSWAARHGVSLAAVQDLEFALRIGPVVDLTAEKINPEQRASEARQQDLVRLEAARRGMRLFRNNVGALQDERGVPVRYGLANDSAKLNKVLKSSDLIGWTPQTIGGQTVAVFTAIEMKEQGWNYSASQHEQAQLAFINLVVADGGIAKFCTGPDEL